MIWRIIICIFVIAIGVNLLSQIAKDYKYHPNESPVPEQAGAVTATVLICFFVYKGFRRKNNELIKDMTNKMPSKETIVWTGDLSDDCTALWNGLMLRAEWMHDQRWWWAVSKIETNEEIDSSNNYEGNVSGGKLARSKAESAAKIYFESNSLKF